MSNVLTDAKMHKGEKQREKRRFYSSSVHRLLQSVRPSKLFTMSLSQLLSCPLPTCPSTPPSRMPKCIKERNREREREREKTLLFFFSSLSSSIWKTKKTIHSEFCPPQNNNTTQQLSSPTPTPITPSLFFFPHPHPPIFLYCFFLGYYYYYHLTTRYAYI